MTNKEFAALLLNKRIVGVEFAPETGGETLIKKIMLHDHSILELRGENGYASFTVAALTKSEAA